MDSMQKGEVIAIASDHAGFLLKGVLLEDLKDLGYKVLDLGARIVWIQWIIPFSPKTSLPL